MLFENRHDDFGGFYFSELNIDECFLNVSRVNRFEESAYLYGINKNCHGCPLKRIRELSGFESNIEVLSTQYPWDFRFRAEGSELYIQRDEEDPYEICNFENVVLNEFGAYNLILQHESRNNCVQFDNIVAPVDVIQPLIFYVVFILFALLFYFFGCTLFQILRKKFKENKDDETNQDRITNVQRNRIHSLDVFRGISISLMIFVNDGGGHYYFMEHATWNGLYVADLAFPWFLWIMGFCIPISFINLRRRKTRLTQTIKEITRRSLVLFALGIFWTNNGWIDLSKIRIPGVLQRFAICYCIVGYTLAPLFFYMKFYNDEEGNIKDITNLWPRWIPTLLLIALHTLIIFLLPVPGCPTGYLGPGGLNLFNITSAGDCIGGATGYLDRQIFTTYHIYSNPTAKPVYDSNAFDPEGFLGSLTSALTVFLGSQGGFILLSYKNEAKIQIVGRFLAWGIITSILGGALAGFSVENGPIPINKNLWSLSYVFVTNGLAFLFISILYYFVDVLKIWNGAPFVYAGMNSILLYLGHSTAWKMLPFHYVVGPMNTHFAKLTEALWGVSLWLVIAYILHRKRIYITV